MRAPCKESLQSRRLRWKFNFFPAYRGTGGRVEFISSDYTYVRVRLPLNWRTKNYVGTIFGGSMYGAVDPILMIMFMFQLGKEYTVWDRAASISFDKPGRSTLRAEFVVSDDEVQAVKDELLHSSKLLKTYSIELMDEGGVACARIEKTLYFAKKNPRRY
jgi:acyl-coenzyme A thioesterase PaaI-like protein